MTVWLDANSYQRVRLVVWSYLKIVRTIGMPGVSMHGSLTLNMLTSPDVEIHHLEVRKPLYFGNVSIAEEGPLRAAVKTSVTFGQSRVDLTVSEYTRMSAEY